MSLIRAVLSDIAKNIKLIVLVYLLVSIAFLLGVEYDKNNLEMSMLFFAAILFFATFIVAALGNKGNMWKSNLQIKSLKNRRAKSIFHYADDNCDRTSFIFWRIYVRWNLCNVNRNGFNCFFITIHGCSWCEQRAEIIYTRKNKTSRLLMVYK